MITDEDLKDVLWGISLSDHLGDVARSLKPILKHFGMEMMSLDALHDEMKKRDLLPQYARDDYDANAYSPDSP